MSQTAERVAWEAWVVAIHRAIFRPLQLCLVRFSLGQILPPTLLYRDHLHVHAPLLCLPFDLLAQGVV